MLTLKERENDKHLGTRGVEILLILIQRPTPNCWTSVHHELHMNAAKQRVSLRVGDVLGPGSAPGSDI